MEQRLGEPPPETPRSFDEILGRLSSDVLPFAARTGHPRYFAFIPGSGTWPGALGHLIASVSNIENSSWLDSLRDVAGFGDRIRRAVRERLPGL
jgi:aromatic-L-amino-acid/L-tryptophan decarboxylase